MEQSFPEMKYTMDQDFTVKKPSKDPPINIKNELPIKENNFLA